MATIKASMMDIDIPQEVTVGMKQRKMFDKGVPLENEIYCPYDDTSYNQVPGYVSGYGCPVCKAIGVYHLPVLKSNFKEIRGK